MSFRKSGSTGLSVFLVFLIIITGSVFLNSISARKTFRPDNVRTMIDKLDIPRSVSIRLNSIEFSSYIDLSEKANEVLTSQSFDDLLDRYAEYLSDYMLNGSSEKEITDSELSAFFTPFVEEWTGDLLNAGTVTEDFQHSLIDTVVTNISSVFVSLDDYLTGNLSGMLRFALSAATRNISLILIIILLALLLLAARPRRFFAFTGAAAALAGVCSLAVGQLVYTFFSGTFSNPLLPYLLQDYSDNITSLSITVGAAGAVIFIAGIIIALVTRPRTNWW